MSKKRPKIPDDYFDKLRQDPEILKAREENERRHLARRDAYIKLQSSLLQRLSSLGYTADTWDSFVSQNAPLPLPAVQVLLDVLKDADYKLLQQSIVRALAVARHRFDGQVLTQIYDAAWEDEGLRFAIFSTIALTHPRGIGSWLEKFKQNAYHRKELEGLGIDWTYFDEEQPDHSKEPKH